MKEKLQQKVKDKGDFIKIHKDLHKSLDQLLACWIKADIGNLTNTSLMEFLEWSSKQTKNPSCFERLTLTT